LTINDLCKHAHEAAMTKGWYDKERELPELLMLTVSELSECLEADRENHWTNVIIRELADNFNLGRFKEYVNHSVEDELADTFIRLSDICGFYGIDIESHIRAKMAYNETRPNKHGKAY
jgi:NTP pyrophosphatase (non-canonical NTP hydrolase)